MRPLEQITEWFQPESSVEILKPLPGHSGEFHVRLSVITHESRVDWPRKPLFATETVSYRTWCEREAKRLVGRVKKLDGKFAVFAPAHLHGPKRANRVLAHRNLLTP